MLPIVIFFAVFAFLNKLLLKKIEGYSKRLIQKKYNYSVERKKSKSIIYLLRELWSSYYTENAS